MILIEGAPHSVEIWVWYNENKHLVGGARSFRPTAFQYLVLKIANCPGDYREMNAGQFWEFLWALMTHASGLDEVLTPPSVSVEQLEEELQVIKSIGIWWALAEGLEETDLGNFDHVHVDKLRGRLDHTYRYKFYYIWKIIELALNKTKKMLTTMENGQVSAMEQVRDVGTDIFQDLIREKAMGDLDEFIMYTIQHIQFTTLTSSHEKIALLERYLKFKKDNFEEKLPPSEIWRFLFPNYFDDLEDYYDKFYKRFKNECVLYFLNDYISEDYGVVKIPFYNLYTNDNGRNVSPTALAMVDTGAVLRDIKRIESSFAKS